MKLVEILARDMRKWQDGAEHAYQDKSGNVFFSRGQRPEQFRDGGSWNVSASAVEMIYGGRFGDEFQLASDHSTAIITREMWEAERVKQKGDKQVKANKEGWIRHRGGKCPVEGNPKVEIRLRNGEIVTMHAQAVSWEHSGMKWLREVMAYRLHKPKPEISDDETIDLCVACADEEMPAAKYFDGPLQWRDRITEIDATTEALEEERASLIQRLEDEGFALIKRKVEPVMPVEDMSDWRNWRAGDEVICITDKWPNIYQNGKSYKVKSVEQHQALLFDETGGSCAIGDEVSPNFKWHSRPAS